MYHLQANVKNAGNWTCEVADHLGDDRILKKGGLPKRGGSNIKGGGIIPLCPLCIGFASALII